MKVIIQYISLAGLLSCGRTTFAPRAHAQGGVPLWTNRYNGPGNGWDQPRAIAVDGNGHVFVTGDSAGTSGLPDYATIVTIT